MSGKIFPNLNATGGVDPRILTRGQIVGADQRDKHLKQTSLTRDALIVKAKALHAEEKEVSKVARALRKNEKKNRGKSHSDVAMERQLKEIARNVEAEQEGPQDRKAFSLHDMKEILPKTKNQEETFFSWNEDKNLVLSGTAGTGKSFISIYLGLREILDTDVTQKKLVIVRSVVPVRDMGFLPGDDNEKSEVYEIPYVNLFDELFPYRRSYDSMKRRGLVEFMTTSFMRGITIRDAIIFVDEVENMTFQEIATVITRVGEGSRIIFAGDTLQTDLNKRTNDQSGMRDFLELAKMMPSFDIIRFDQNDIVRSGVVREFIIAREKAGI